VEIGIDYQEVRDYVKYVNSIDPEDKILLNLRILSFDIDCITEPPDFDYPHVQKDHVLQIGNNLKDYSKSKEIPPGPAFFLKESFFCYGK
jgi:DNA polymerase family B, exonuclease domain